MGLVLNVAEACSGLRALGTFITMGAIVAFLTRRPAWQKIAIMLWTVPIAVACNVARVTGVGLLDFYVSQRFIEGAYHESIGYAMIVAGFLLIVAVAWLLDHLFIGGDPTIPHAPARAPLRTPPFARPRWHPTFKEK